MNESADLSLDSMYCHNCGAMIDRKSVFCSWCGVSVASAAVAAPLPTEAVTSLSDTPAPPMPPPPYVPYSSTSVPSTDATAVRHSSSGVASFVIFCVSFVILIVTLGAFIDNTDNQRVSDAVLQALSLLFTLNIGLMLIGVSTGIIGIVQSNRKKIFGILGLVFNGVLLFIMLGLALLGYLASTA